MRSFCYLRNFLPDPRVQRETPRAPRCRELVREGEALSGSSSSVSTNGGEESGKIFGCAGVGMKNKAWRLSHVLPAVMLCFLLTACAGGISAPGGGGGSGGG